MKRFSLATLAATLVMSTAAFAQSGLSWKLLDSSVPSNATHQIHVQLIDGSGHAVAQAVTALTVRVDMGPDGMADMTTPAKVSLGKAPGDVVVETNLYAPGRWAVIVSGAVKGAPVKASLVVTAKP
ncbi:MAG: FixH family protein [Rhizomicrobium sp.]|nr:FixH family protein [Rhizomicrobium sp.]